MIASKRNNHASASRQPLLSFIRSPATCSQEWASPATLNGSSVPITAYSDVAHPKKLLTAANGVATAPRTWRNNRSRVFTHLRMPTTSLAVLIKTGRRVQAGGGNNACVPIDQRGNIKSSTGLVIIIVRSSTTLAMTDRSPSTGGHNRVVP